jgi:hypothetical protein
MLIVSHAQWKWPLKRKVHKKPGKLKYYVAWSAKLVRVVVGKFGARGSNGHSRKPWWTSTDIVIMMKTPNLFLGCFQTLQMYHPRLKQGSQSPDLTCPKLNIVSTKPHAVEGEGTRVVIWSAMAHLGPPCSMMCW